MGLYEDKYKIEVFIEPWQRRMNGYDCYATYYVTNMDTMKKGFSRHENINLPKKLLEDYLIENDEPYRVEMDPDAPEFWMRLNYSPEPIFENTYELVTALGDYFNFVDLDFSGGKELVVRSHFSGQGHSDAFKVYDMDQLDGALEANWNLMAPCGLFELVSKSEKPLSDLDESSKVDLPAD